MTVWERIKIFPTSVSRLWKDWLLYQNIRDASLTPRNAWTIPGTTKTTIKTTKNANKNNAVDEGRTVVSTAEAPLLLVAKQMVHSHIPWRQREQQRRFLDGLSTVLPVVILWCVPIVGYVPMLLAIAAPRQLLSRHFHNDFEAVQYNRLAYRQRHAHFATVVQEMCSIRTKNDDDTDDETTPASWIEMWHKDGAAAVDAAGPVLDNLLPFYQSVFASKSGTSNGKNSNGALWLSSVDRFPRNYLVHFALAVGVYQTFPSSWSATLAQLSPSWWLRRRVRYIALTVEDDDHALLLQRETSFGAKRGAAVVAQLTEMEVTDACLVRGLPIIHTITGEHDNEDDHQHLPLTAEQMRECLSNHLDMIASLEEQIAAQQLQQQHAQDDSERQRNKNSDGSNGSPPQQQGRRRRRRLLSVNEEALGLFTLHITILRDHLKTRR